MPSKRKRNVKKNKFKTKKKRFCKKLFNRLKRKEIKREKYEKCLRNQHLTLPRYISTRQTKSTERYIGTTTLNLTTNENVNKIKINLLILGICAPFAVFLVLGIGYSIKVLKKNPKKGVYIINC